MRRDLDGGIVSDDPPQEFFRATRLRTLYTSSRGV